MYSSINKQMPDSGRTMKNNTAGSGALQWCRGLWSHTGVKANNLWIEIFSEAGWNQVSVAEQHRQRKHSRTQQILGIWVKHTCIKELKVPIPMPWLQRQNDHSREPETEWVSGSCLNRSGTLPGQIPQSPEDQGSACQQARSMSKEARIQSISLIFYARILAAQVISCNMF